MTELEMWERMATAWEKRKKHKNYIGDVYIILYGHKCYGLCGTAERIANRFSQTIDVYRVVMNKIEPKRKAQLGWYAWPMTMQGAQWRVAFCRKQAAKLRAEQARKGRLQLCIYLWSICTGFRKEREMKKEDLERIKAYCEAATPGRWNQIATHAGDKTLKIDSPKSNLSERIAIIPRDDVTEKQAVQVAANAMFIYSSRTDLPACVAEIERLQAEVKKIRADALEEAEKACERVQMFGSENATVHFRTCDLVIQELRALAKKDGLYV